VSKSREILAAKDQQPTRFGRSDGGSSKLIIEERGYLSQNLSRFTAGDDLVVDEYLQRPLEYPGELICPLTIFPQDLTT
jgi:hypothetical protein